MKLLDRMALIKDVKKTVPHWADIDRTLLMGLRGSDAHGTKLEKGPSDIDDVDVFSIIVHPIEYYLGFNGYTLKREHWDSNGKELDVLVYDIRKFMHLASSCNPNVINWLFNRDEDYLYIHPIGQRLIDIREMFLSKEIFPRLSGYAYSQMKRMNAEQAYQGYMGAKRKALVDEYGYDLKNAAHCVRLLNMSIEVATTGRMTSYRPQDEIDLIKNIKSGEYTLKEITQLIEDLTEKAKEHEKLSMLPNVCDKNFLSNVLENIIIDFNLKVIEKL